VQNPTDFLPADDRAPFSAEDYLQAIPPKARVRGMFFNSYIEQAEKRGIALDAKSHVSFKLYPLDDWARFALEVSRAFWPDEPLRGGLRRAGLAAYPTFADSLIGRIIFGAVGKDVGLVLRLAGKGYEHSLEPGSCTVVEVGDHYALLVLKDVYTFVDVYHVGVFEGVLAACGRKGQVFCKRNSVSAAEFYITWE
jgi:uncharacterized protein (TIGR02265 family)